MLRISVTKIFLYFFYIVYRLLLDVQTDGAKVWPVNV